MYIQYDGKRTEWNGTSGIYSEYLDNIKNQQIWNIVHPYLILHFQKCLVGNSLVLVWEITQWQTAAFNGSHLYIERIIEFSDGVSLKCECYALIDVSYTFHECCDCRLNN